MAESKLNVDEIAAGYYEHWKSGSEDLFWAWEAVDKLSKELATGMDISLRLIASADDDAYLAYVAAGPVEDLIKDHGNAALAAFKEAAKTSPRVLQALGKVWMHPSDEGFAEWNRIVRK